MLTTHTGKVVERDGDHVLAIQGTRKLDGRMDVNIDWSFAPGVSMAELKSMFGGLLANLEDLYGEKFVTELIAHYAEDTNKLVKLSNSNVAFLKSHNIDFKKR